MNLAFPYAFDGTGHTAQTDPLTHIGDMIEQILFTSPGERVNRPTFGSGTAQLVFAPNSDVLAAAQQQAVQAALQQWLSDLIRVQSVKVTADDSTLQMTVIYTVIQSQQQQTQQFVYGGERLMIYFCSQSNRRELVLQSPTLNGIDYLEVSATPAAATQLARHLPQGRARARPDRRATSASPAAPPSPSPRSRRPPPRTRRRHGQARPDRRLLHLHVLRWSPGLASVDPPSGLDPQLSSIEFSFKAGCPTPADCLPGNCCPATTAGAAGHQLSGQGLRRLPAGDARPPGRARPRAGPRPTPPTWGSRWSRPWHTPPITSAISRTRSAPRRTSARRAAGSRCAGTPGWSTTRSTRAATPARRVR